MAKKKPNPKEDVYGLPSLSLVFGYMAVKELQRLEDRVEVLTRLGYGSAEIAQICDTTTATVHTLRSRLRKGAKRR
jgi:DNA-binding CsgD family transcriptional regulator